jgi:hypothetical protein
VETDEPAANIALHKNLSRLIKLQAAEPKKGK